MTTPSCDDCHATPAAPCSGVCNRRLCPDHGKPCADCKQVFCRTVCGFPDANDGVVCIWCAGKRASNGPPACFLCLDPGSLKCVRCGRNGCTDHAQTCDRCKLSHCDWCVQRALLQTSYVCSECMIAMLE